MLREFKEFQFRGNIVDLAGAIVVGTAFVALVKALRIEREERGCLLLFSMCTPASFFRFFLVCFAAFLLALLCGFCAAVVS